MRFCSGYLLWPTSGMKISLCFCVILAVGLALANNNIFQILRHHERNVNHEEINTVQFMGAANEGEEDDEEETVENGLGIKPTKHPFQQCLEEYHVCVENSCRIWERQTKCLLHFYRCQNEYTGKCRELYKTSACYNLLGRDSCRKKLIRCYGSDKGKGD